MRNTPRVGQSPFPLKAEDPERVFHLDSCCGSSGISVCRRDSGGHSSEDTGHPAYSEDKAWAQLEPWGWRMAPGWMPSMPRPQFCPEPISVLLQGECQTGVAEHPVVSHHPVTVPPLAVLWAHLLPQVFPVPHPSLDCLFYLPLCLLYICVYFFLLHRLKFSKR